MHHKKAINSSLIRHIDETESKGLYWYYRGKVSSCKIASAAIVRQIISIYSMAHTHWIVVAYPFPIYLAIPLPMYCWRTHG